MHLLASPQHPTLALAQYPSRMGRTAHLHFTSARASVGVPLTK